MAWKKSQPSSEMLRLPSDVITAIRRRAAESGITLGEAARQLMLAKDLGGRHGTLEHLEWLHDRLLKEQTELEDVLGYQGRDMSVVRRLIEAIANLREEWEWAEIDEDDSPYHPQ
jgi:hypothetical protein